jgi:NADPH:quinone reductase-like Zn-dependent oxidoreductase
MRAMIYEKYGPPEVLQLKEIEKPAPNAHEVLIKVRATTVTAGDWRARTLNMPGGFGPLGRLVFGILKPRQPILGCELAGDIEAVGKDVRRFNVGDQVFAFTAVAMGCHAEYKCLSEVGRLALKPPGLSYEEAAALSSGGTTALHFFRKADLKSGEKVLINGASGGVGTAAVQLARHFGADVTAVCSAGNAALVSSLGAARVIDYTKEDFVKNGETYDVIVDTAGTAPFSRSKASLKEGGRLLRVLGGLSDLFQAPWVSLTSRRKMIAGPAAAGAQDLQMLADLAKAGKFRPVIDRSYPFEQLVEAHRYVDSGRKKGNVVITVTTS